MVVIKSNIAPIRGFFLKQETLTDSLQSLPLWVSVYSVALIADTAYLQYIYRCLCGVGSRLRTLFLSGDRRVNC